MKVLIQSYNIKDLITMSGSILQSVLSPVRIHNLVKVKISKALKKNRVSGFPINILVEPTRHCNYACLQCPRQEFPEIKNLNKMEISLAEFKLIMRRIGRYLFTIRFWHYGEPLKNRELPKMIKVAKDLKIFTVISSNCSILSGEIGRDLIESGLDYLLVSLNAATGKTHKKFTQTDSFDDVVNNLKQFVNLKKKLGFRRPFVNLQFIVMKENFNEVQEMKKLSKHIGADKLSFKYPGFKRNELGVDDSRYQLKGLENNYFCSLPYEECVISANGDVTPCAPDMRNQYVMGNVFNEDFKLIWNNLKYSRFRELMNKDINSIGICKDCPKKNNPDFFIEI